MHILNQPSTPLELPLLDCTLRYGKQPNLRQSISNGIAQYAVKTMQSKVVVWQLVYDLLHANYGIDLSQVPKYKHECKLAIAERLGYLDRIFEVIENRLS